MYVFTQIVVLQLFLCLPNEEGSEDHLSPPSLSLFFFLRMGESRRGQFCLFWRAFPFLTEQHYRGGDKNARPTLIDTVASACQLRPRDVGAVELPKGNLPLPACSLCFTLQLIF